MNKDDLEFVIDMIKGASEEAQQYKDENDFCKGVAFAYRCVLNMFKNFGCMGDL